MFLFISILHILTCLFLILFIMLQNPKGGALGVFGGQSSSKSVFASTGGSDFLVSITKWCAIVFALTSILMTYINVKKESSVILDQPLIETSSPATPSKENSPSPSPTKDKASPLNNPSSK